MRSRRLLLPLFCLFLMPVTASTASGQAPPRLPIHGRILDPSRAPIAGARITALTAVAPPVSTVTNERGEFLLQLAAQDYTLTIEAQGFVSFTELRSATEAPAATVEFVLQLVGLQEHVDVTASSGYHAPWVASATRTPTPLRDVPQSVSVITRELMADQLMSGMGDVVRYVPGITAHQGENNRDDIVIRGNRSSADFFVNGVRDDVAYYRDLYNLERVEALKGPNAMIFGRGGGGGVVNRVVKEPLFRPLRSLSLQAGAYAHKRVSTDLNQQFGHRAAVRLNGMFESSGSFRDGVELERSGLNPTLTFAPRSGTRLTAGYEYLRDTRVADRGITSIGGRPAPIDPRTFYGDPEQSQVRARVSIASAAVEQSVGRAVIRNRTVVADYGRFYQNFVPGAPSADGQSVSLTTYNSATDRTNVFNQTDVTYTTRTGRLRHTILAGGEVGRQMTDNLRKTGFFGNTATSLNVPFDQPRLSTPVTFRQSATDADNQVRTNLAAVFVQAQTELGRYVHVLGGLRLDRFDLRYHNNRSGETLGRADKLVSPRAGVVVKPAAAVSVYGSYGVSYLPSSGDQFSSLTTITQQVEPERFNNYEIGVKWDVRPALSFTSAVYRLDRTNTRATDPNDPTRIVQTGSQRTNGYEAGVSGQITPSWRISGGYARQDAVVTSGTTAAPAGAIVGQVPRHMFSLWNNYRVHPRLAAGIGILQRSSMFATISGTVTLPGYARADAAAYFTVTKDLRLQVNVENLLDRKYFVNADSNTNISPGSPRALRLALTAAF